MSDGGNAIAGLISLVVGIGFYLFFCYCVQVICSKCGNDPGVMAYIPIVNIFPLLSAAGMSAIMFILLLIPLVNLVVMIMMWARICTARGKSPALVILMFIPIANIFFVPYLAFSD